VVTRRGLAGDEPERDGVVHLPDTDGRAATDPGLPQLALVWETPPPAQRGRKSTKWAAIVEALKDRPGEWAVIATDAPRASTSGLKNRFPGTQWMSRANATMYDDDGFEQRPTFKVWGRWTG
jgi:hypothetical protein